jgi:hypothetical protein
MSATLLESVKRNEAAQRASALDVYRTIVRRADAPEDGDAERLQAAMETLDLKSADLAADLNALDELRQTEAQVLSRADAAELQRGAAESAAGVHREMREFAKGMIDRLQPHQLQGFLDQLSIGIGVNVPEALLRGWTERWGIAEMNVKGRIGTSNDAVRKVRELRAAHPRALGTNGTA